jgi:tetratricopeptide (TPR) repeat protein
VVAALSLFLTGNAFADQYRGEDVIRCDSPASPYRVDFTTMTGASADGDHFKLEWRGTVLRMDTDHPHAAAYWIGTDVRTGKGEIGLPNTSFTDPVECRDDRGLIPNAHFKPPDPAQAQAENQPPPQAAKAVSTKLSAAQKGKAQASFKRAFELFQAGELEAAIVGFKQGLAIDPGDGRANYYLGECYARQNQDDLARVRYQRAIDLAPGSKEAFLAQARLDKE